jgi:hypothetical protein
MGELLRDLASVDGEIAVLLLLLLQQRIPKNGSTFPHSTNCIFTTGHGDQNKTKKQVIVNFF